MSLGFSASDLLALPQFAWKVYKACRDSAADFTQLASEIQSMHTVLNELATQHRRRCLTDESISRLVTIQKGCQEILKSVEDQLLKYKNLGTGKKRLRDKLRWSLEGIGNLRLRLISHTNMLTLFIVTLERYERGFLVLASSTGDTLDQSDSSAMLTRIVLYREGVAMDWPNIIKEPEVLLCL